MAPFLSCLLMQGASDEVITAIQTRAASAQQPPAEAGGRGGGEKVALYFLAASPGRISPQYLSRLAEQQDL